MELKEMEIRNPRNEGFESPRFFFFNRCRTRRVQQIASFFSISAHGLMGGLGPVVWIAGIPGKWKGVLLKAKLFVKHQS